MKFATLFLLLFFAHPASAQLRIPQFIKADTVQPGLTLSEFTIEAGRAGLDLRIIVLRIDPKVFSFSLVHSTRANRMTGAWNVDLAPETAAVAINAGQFKETGPWGWLVLGGEERRSPGYGPLSAGVAFDTAGTLHWIPFRGLERRRNDRGIAYAFQSYPLLLSNGRVPPLATRSDLVDQGHRDIRLILAQDRERELLVILTRYDGLGAVGSRAPIGLTVPESIELARALGAHHAVMLDGGVSAQMVVRDRSGRTRKWKGFRDVPLALIVTPRNPK
jgi:hypothetical protein